MVQKNFIGLTNHKTKVKCKSNINVMILSRKQQNVLHYLQRNEMEPIKLFFEMEAGRLMISSVRLTRLFIFLFFETKLKVKIQKKRGLINRYDDPTSWEFNREKMIIFSITIATIHLKSETMPKPTFANQHHLKWVFISISIFLASVLEHLNFCMKMILITNWS